MTARDTRYLRIYRLLLRLLPRDFRRHHETEMSALVRDRLRDAQSGDVASWWRQAMLEGIDVVRVAWRLRVPRWRTADLRISVPTALRSMRRRPAFALLGLLTLTLGITVATSAAAVIDSVLVRRLTHADPSRLVMIWRTIPRPAIARGPTSYPDYLDWRDGVRAFSSIAAYTRTSLTLQTDEQPDRVTGVRVSGNLFRTLGNRAASGRVISDDDDRRSADRVVVLSDVLWRRRFSADSAVLGRHVVLGDEVYRVVGVMPADFVFPSRAVELWIPLRVDVATAERDENRYTLIGRLAPGVGSDAAQHELEREVQRIAATYPGVNTGSGVRLESRHEYVVGSARPLLVLLGSAAGVVLVVAGVNLASLFLVRGVARRREIAVRCALGATRGAILREALAEGICVGVASGTMASALAASLTSLLVRFGPGIPRATEIGVSARTVVLALGMSTCIALAAALIPVLRLRPPRLGETLASRSGAGPAARRLYASFVALQIALALTLFVAAGLLSRSFYNLVTVPRGFDGSRVLTAHVSLPRASYGTNERILIFYEALLASLSALPGVQAASGTWALPFSDDYASSAIVPADRPTPDKPQPTVVVPVFQGFFGSIGVPVTRGRDFLSGDGASSPDVAIVNETLARRYWPDGNAVGKSLRPADPSDGGSITIVGVVSDIKRRGLDTPVEPEIYRPFAQQLLSGDLYLTLFADNPLSLVPALRRAISDADHTLPLTLVGTLDDLVNASIVGPRFRTTIIAAFAALAGMMALIGVYGVLAFVVAQRKHDIAVCGALGATPGRLVCDVLSQGSLIAVAGVALGLAGGVVAGVVVRTMVFGVSPLDPATYIGAVVALGLVTLVGCWLPARRAAGIDPMTVLREDSL